MDIIWWGMGHCERLDRGWKTYRTNFWRPLQAKLGLKLVRSNTDKDTIKVSESAYDQWRHLPPAEQQQYSPHNFSHTSTIKTSAQIDIAIAKEQIRKMIVAIEKELYKDPTGDKLQKLESKHSHLLSIDTDMDMLDTNSKDSVTEMKNKIEAKINDMYKKGHFTFPYSSTKRNLEKTLTALNKALIEFKISEPISAKSNDNIQNQPITNKNSTMKNFKAFKAAAHKNYVQSVKAAAEDNVSEASNQKAPK